jgi:hypothetical protein
LRLVLLPLALIAVIAAMGLISQDGMSETAPPPDAKLVEIGRFDEPVHVTSPAGDDRLFVVEKKGKIWVVDEGRRLSRPFLDLSHLVSVEGSEEGLLSLAFAPDYASTGLFYVDYTDRRHWSVVEEYRRATNPNRADSRTARRVLVIPDETNRHNGGLLLFGPDELMYIGQGDAGGSSPGNFPAQRLDNLHGKILRVDPRRAGRRPYRIPEGNPFVGRPGRDEIWAYGLRNPWRFGFDPATKALVIGDVGQLSAEEIDIASRGGVNFGWSCFEGTSQFAHGLNGPPSCTEATPPAIELVRGSARVSESSADPAVTRGRPRTDTRLMPGDPVCSIVAGVAVQDPALTALVGRHLDGDFCASSLHSFRLEGERAVDDRPLGVDVPLLSSFGVDARQHVYALSLAGPVYRLEAP